MTEEQNDKIDIKSMNYDEVKEYVKSINEKPFRAKQLYEWIHKNLVLSFDEMTNLSKDFRLSTLHFLHFPLLLLYMY